MRYSFYVWLLIFCLFIAGSYVGNATAQESDLPLSPRPQIDLFQQDQDPNKESDQKEAEEAEKDGSSSDQPKKQADEKADEAGQADKQGDESETVQQPTRRTRFSRASRDRIRRNGEAMRDLFLNVVERASKSTVAIKSEDQQIALGTIVDENGFILTKKSELKGQVSCLLNDGSEVPAYVFGIHEPTDLALLKIEKTGLAPIVWNVQETATAGSWLITSHPDGSVTSLGVISVEPRVISGGHGFLGITMDTRFEGTGAKIQEVTPKSPAEKGGLKIGDRIIRVGDKDIGNSNDLREAISSKSPGDEVLLTVAREGNTLQLKVILGSNLDLNPQMARSNFQNTMGGRLSKRRYDFPSAFQHDAVLSPNQCGGPVVNIEGDAIGLNVARNGRVASLALPVSTLLPVIEELMSGELAPAIVNKGQIDSINLRLGEIDRTLSVDPDASTRLTNELTELEKKEKEADQALQEALKKIKEAQAAKARVEYELEQVQGRLKTANSEKKKLERRREQLVTGIDK